MQDLNMRRFSDNSTNKLMTLLTGITKQLNKHGLLKKFFNHLPIANEKHKDLFLEAVLSEYTTHPSEWAHIKGSFMVAERAKGQEEHKTAYQLQSTAPSDENSGVLQITPTQKLKIEGRLLGEWLYISKPIESSTIKAAVKSGGKKEGQVIPGKLINV